MIAALIMIMVAGAIYGLTSSIVRLNTFADRVTTAAVLGEAKLEELRGRDYDAVAPGSDSVDGFTRRWTVTASSSPPSKAVVVRVGWRDAEGPQEETQVKTILVN
jgi:hypothetical protein